MKEPPLSLIKRLVVLFFVIFLACLNANSHGLNTSTVYYYYTGERSIGWGRSRIHSLSFSVRGGDEYENIKIEIVYA